MCVLTAAGSGVQHADGCRRNPCRQRLLTDFLVDGKTTGERVGGGGVVKKLVSSNRGQEAQARVVPVDEEIARHVVALRIDRKLKLLDAIVLATAYVKNPVLITRDTDFKADDPLVKMPYKL
jgi:hypothetical protein